MSKNENALDVHTTYMDVALTDKRKDKPQSAGLPLRGRCLCSEMAEEQSSLAPEIQRFRGSSTAGCKYARHLVAQNSRR